MKFNFELKFKYPWQEDLFYDELLKNSTRIISEPAVEEPHGTGAFLGAILNLYFLHNTLEKDARFHFCGIDDIITYCYVDDFEKEFHTKAKPENFIELATIEIPAEYSIDKLISIFFDEPLLEEKRSMLIQKSKAVGMYKQIGHGRNRFERKKYSKIANSVKQYNTIDMNNLFKKDTLQVEVPIIGESDSYRVTIKMEGVIAELQKNIKNNNNKLEFKSVVQALTKVFNSSDIYVKCTCSDFKYRFAHHLIVNNISVDDSSKDPGPGKGIANPKDDKGRGCKHILLVLANGDWLIKVASTLNNYINYAAEKLQKPFLKLIFPKLYGVPAEDAVDAGLVEKEEDLKTTTNLIDKINTWAKTRGLKQNKNKPAPEPEDTTEAEN